MKTAILGFAFVFGVACGSYCIWSVIAGIRSRTIAAIDRGRPRRVSRADHPRGFWVAVAWNASFGALCFFGVGEIIGDLTAHLQGI